MYGLIRKIRILFCLNKGSFIRRKIKRGIILTKTVVLLERKKYISFTSRIIRIKIRIIRIVAVDAHVDERHETDAIFY